MALIVDKPVVESLTRVSVPEVVFRYEPAAAERWKAAQPGWQQSGFTDFSVWGDYAELVAEERMWIARKFGNAAFKFVEFHAALVLTRAGYECWGGVQLFDYDLMKKGKGPARKNTEALREHPDRTWRWPAEFQGSLNFRPKNPDLVAYHQVRREWLFAEVKKNDGCHPNQINALGVLHLHTASPVAVIRLIPEGRTRERKAYEAKIDYVKNADLAWVHTDF